MIDEKAIGIARNMKRLIAFEGLSVLFWLAHIECIVKPAIQKPEMPPQITNRRIILAIVFYLLHTGGQSSAFGLQPMLCREA